MVSPQVYRFSLAYRPFFEVACPVLCVVGIVSNCLNILILSKKKMKSPLNVLLCWLAAADGLTMISVLIYNIQYHRLDEYYGGALRTIQIVLVCINASVLFHSIAIWLAVALAMFKSIIVFFPFRAGRLCTFSRVHIAAGTISILMTAVTIPNMYVNTIQSHRFTTTDNTTMNRYYINFRSQSFSQFNIILYSVACKLLPCVLLLVLNGVLIQGMRQAKRRHLELTSGTFNQSAHSNRTDNKSGSTGMLVAVVTLSILTETPQAVMIFWSRFDEEVKTLYTLLGDLFDTLTIINSGVNFLLYCTMSSKFRKTFINVMRRSVNPRLWFMKKRSSTLENFET
ncbi:sex peptide receptor-like [Plakobranchus ocellatus]|uniref:Sex peptide receptor-like n=1 Tax=Plakobranchus ocellatus TaxID=259542 RepID=A0AAV4BUI6_9GAST|nr:sex peptide receptor-like [Plakobranchus ocellatus]